MAGKAPLIATWAAFDEYKPMEKPVYRTQKARSLEPAWKLSMLSGNGYRVASAHGVYPTNWNAPMIEQLVSTGHNLFARPCPVQPRHGFVESRPIASMAELEAVIKETMAADPQGEVILMRKLSGLYSAVMTGTGAVWGRGHCGVTAGVGEQRDIPCPRGSFDYTLLGYLGLSSEQLGVYCELVEDNGHVCVVQMRTGPQLTSAVAKRFVPPAAQPIEDILQPTPTEYGDLIAWSNTLARKKDAAPKTVVWLPGQSLSSHFAVQAIAGGYNVSTEVHRPTIAEIMTPDNSAPAPLVDADYAYLAKCLEAERDFTFWDGPRDVLLSVATLHALPLWGNQPWLLRLRARGIMIAVRYGLAACLGESRHLIVRLTDDDKQGGRKCAVPWAKLLGKKGNVVLETPDRGYVFTRTFISPWTTLRSLAKAAADDMWLNGHPRVKDWMAKGNNLSDFKCSFRGHRWEWAAHQVHDLICAVNKFIRKPDANSWGIVLGFYNAIINAAHNGGYLLNKWVEARHIDRVAGTPAYVFGYPQVMRVVWENAAEPAPQTWLPYSLMPSEKSFEYSYLAGIYIHKNLVEILKKQGILDAAADLPCKCSKCLMNARKAIGHSANTYGMPCYVSFSLMAEMPFVEAALLTHHGYSASPPPEDDDDNDSEDNDNG